MKNEYIDWSQDEAQVAPQVALEVDRKSTGSEATGNGPAHGISCDDDPLLLEFINDKTHKIKCERMKNSASQKLSTYDDITAEMIEFQPIKWNQVRVETLNSTTWYAEIPPTSNGFRALMIEVTYQGPDDFSGMTFTTEVMITPDVRPFTRCKDAGCYSFLI